MTEKRVILYGTTICPMVPPVRSILTRAEVEFEYVNISGDAEARTVVREINDGNESVPTLVFPDGSTLTEPPGAVLEEKLIALGYSIPELTPLQRIQTALQSPFALMVGVLGLLLGYLLEQPLLTTIGVICLAAALVVGLLARRVGR
jgi:mycoredoxin